MSLPTEQLGELIVTVGVMAHIVYQLLERFVFNKPVDSRVFKLETNHIPHLEADIRRIEGKLDELHLKCDKIMSILGKHNSRLVRLETLDEVRG